MLVQESQQLEHYEVVIHRTESKNCANRDLGADVEVGTNQEEDRKNGKSPVRNGVDDGVGVRRPEDH